MINTEIKQLRPNILWKHFSEICNIPHPSKHEQQIIEYIKQFAIAQKLEYKIDNVGNIVVLKPATFGFEHRKKLVLQSHVDMVPQKNETTVHDFEKDPIQTFIEGEWVKAKGTTLGADNGIGAAAALATLEDATLEHGPIEALFTIDEETGMTGAFELKPDFLNGEILLNLDTEDEGELCIGCAGGVNTTANFTISYEKTPSDFGSFKISLTGLNGGHSGIDINMGRGNANKLMARLLWNATKDFNIRIITIDGGTLRNAIPREAFACIAIAKGEEAYFRTFIEEFKQTVSKELAFTEPNLNIIVENTCKSEYSFSSDFQNRALSAIYGVINGSVRMSDGLKDVVETSTNLAIVKTFSGMLEVKFLVRSSIESAKDDLCKTIESTMQLAGAEVKHSGSYPGWKPNIDSDILRIMKETHIKLYNKEAHVVVVHAGLECGIIGSVYPDMEMVSFGPTIKYPHSPDEKVHIGSVARFWDYLTEVLKNIPVK